MGAATLFGVLSGLANTGQQLGEARQINTEESTRKLAQLQALERDRIQRQEAQQRILESGQRIQSGRDKTVAAKQPVMIGNPFTANGKEYARFQDPMTGALTVKELPGKPEETPEEAMHRGLLAIGIPEQDASQAVIRKMTGRGTEKREVVPDPQSPTGFSAVYYDTDGNQLWRAATTPPRTMVASTTTGSSTDPYGNVTSHTSTRRPVLPGATGVAPPPPPAAIAAVTAGGSPQVRPAAPTGAPAATPARPVQPPAASAAPNPAEGLQVGPYRGLDAQGSIPEKPGINPLVRSFANDILNGQDVTKIPARARPAAERLAQLYGWKGQGSLSPKEQLQIEEADASIRRLMDPKMLKVLDGVSGMHLSTVTMDAPQSGVFGRLAYRANKATLSADQQQYFNNLNQLRSLMGGFRKFTGGNAAEGQMERYISELPDPATTPSAQDAMRKLMLLHNELEVAKRYGYWPKLDTAAPSPAAKSSGAPAPAASQISDDEFLQKVTKP